MQYKHTFEDLAECSLVYHAFEFGKWCVREAGSLRSVVIDRNEVEFIAVAKQDPLVAW